jgi:hypothetical protein
MKFKLFLAGVAIAATFNVSSLPVKAQEMCGPNSGIFVCNRPTESGVGNHTYLWDARNSQACGTSQFSTSEGDVNRSEAGPKTDSCNFVPLSEGRENEVMNQCKEHADDGIWVPYINDCHNAARESVESNGLSYPGSPGGRIGDRNYSGSDSPKWGESTGMGGSGGGSEDGSGGGGIMYDNWGY